jgi:hypothetical protein
MENINAKGLVQAQPESERQGDKGTRGQGDKEKLQKLSLSPCLLVSLSPCLYQVLRNSE